MSDQSTSEKTAGLPPELWLKILSSPEHELSYFDLKRLSRVSTEFGKLLEDRTFDSQLFRSSLAAEPVAQGTPIKLHPFLLEAQLVISKPEDAVIYGRSRGSDSLVIFKPMDYAARLENAAEPPLGKFYLREIGPENGWVKSSRKDQPVSVEDTIRRIAELWMVEVLPAGGRGQPKPYLTVLRKNSNHQFWEGWDTWSGPFKMGKSAVVLTARGLGS